MYQSIAFFSFKLYFSYFLVWPVIFSCNLYIWIIILQVSESRLNFYFSSQPPCLGAAMDPGLTFVGCGYNNNLIFPLSCYFDLLCLSGATGASSITTKNISYITKSALGRKSSPIVLKEIAV